MGIMQAFEPKEWSILRAVFTSMLPVITNNNTELTIMCYLSDLTLRRRRISVTRRVAGMFLEDYDPNSRPLKISYRHTFYCLLSLEMSNIFIRQDYDGPRKDYTINMVGILELCMKMTALRGANISDYLKLLEKTRTVFPSGMDIQRGLEVNVKTIEEAVRLGQELRKSKVGSKKSKKTITHLELQKYMDNAARTHGKSLYQLEGIKDISILRRFIKDCTDLGTTAYEVIDYVLDHYQELNVYSQQSGSFNLAFSVFDFETIYYNKKEVLVWFLHTKEHGFYDVNKSVIEQAGESIGIKVIPFKKRVQK